MDIQGPLLPMVEQALTTYCSADTTSEDDKDLAAEMLAQLNSFTEEDLQHGRGLMNDAKRLLKYLGKKLEQKGESACSHPAWACMF